MTKPFSIDFQGTDEVRRGFDRLTALGKAEVLRNVAQAVYTDVQTAADKHTKTGALARSVKNVPGSTDWFVGHVGRPRYALFVHWGAKPHKIRPKNKRVLRWAAGGKYIFSNGVNHPGYPGDPYFVEAGKRIPALFAAEVRRRLS